MTERTVLAHSGGLDTSAIRMTLHAVARKHSAAPDARNGGGKAVPAQ